MAEQQGDSSDQSNLLSLKWNNHLSNFKGIIASLQEKSILSDATLACDGQLFPVHKLVLSTCSEFFGRVFSSTPCKHPVIVLHDLQPQHLHYLLSYMYVGEVNVPQAHLPTLIRAAETLQIKGLAAPDEELPPVLRSLEPGLTDNLIRKDYYSSTQNTGQEFVNKFANCNKSSTKRRRCFSVDDGRKTSDAQSQDGDHENNTDDNYEKRLNPLNAKRSRKGDDDQGSENIIIDNHEKSSFLTDVKTENVSKSSSLEQVESIKEENDISGNDDVTSLEEGMGGWGDDHGAVNWATSSSQHEGPVTALPWIPFSSPSSAQDCEEAPNRALNYSSEFEQCVEDIPLRVRTSDEEGYSSMQGHLIDHDDRSAGQNGVRPAGGCAQPTLDAGDISIGRAGANSNNCITSDPQLLSVVGRLPSAGGSLREALSSITSSNCTNGGAGVFSAQGVGRSRSMSGSNVSLSKSSHSSATRRQSLVYTGNNSNSDVTNLLSSDTNFGDPNTFSSEIFSNIIGITGGAASKNSGGVVPPSCGLLHECPVCPKTFQSRADVVRHLRTHTGERPYKCPHCQYRAALKGNLKSHILSRHTADKGAVGAILNPAALSK